MTSLTGKKKEKHQLEWLNHEVIITDSETTDDETETCKSPVSVIFDEENRYVKTFNSCVLPLSDHTPIMSDSSLSSPKNLQLIDR